MKKFIKNVFVATVLILGTSLVASAQKKPKPPKPKPPVIKPKPKPKPKPTPKKPEGFIREFRAIIE